MTPEQLKEARIKLGMTTEELGKAIFFNTTDSDKKIEAMESGQAAIPPILEFITANLLKKKCN